MTPAAAAILEGMPDRRLLHRVDRDGTTWVLAGSVVLACYPSADAGLRNVAVAVCRQLGFGGRVVAEVMGLTENYVATLHNRARREGTAGLVRAQGRPRKLPGDAWEKAARWRADRAPAARRPAGMRGRCWPTPTLTGSARRRSWPRRCRPHWPGPATATWGC